jgi:mannose-6-phosphate isomerase-like protein (cupin superfamily)
MMACAHFSFDDIEFDEVIAHAGTKPIFTRRVITEQESSACNFIDLTIVPPGGDIGLHTHTPDNEEIYVIISGYGTMLMDGRRFPVGPGDVILNRPGGTHGFLNCGPSDVRVVVVEMPVRRKGVE